MTENCVEYIAEFAYAVIFGKYAFSICTKDHFICRAVHS